MPGVAEVHDSRPLRVIDDTPSHSAGYRPARAHHEFTVSLGALLGCIAAGVVLAGVLVWQCFWGIPGLKAWFPLDPPPPADVAATAAVSDYLNALAGGDAEAALALSAIPPGPDYTWLRSEVLQEAIERGPITGISEVRTEGEGSDTHQLVSAKYQIGDEEISGWFNVYLVEDQWLLERVATTLDLSSVSPAQIGLKINGRPVTTDRVTLFPGRYELSIDNKWIELLKDSVVIPAPSVDDSLFSTAPALTKDGSKAVVEAVQQKFEACVEAKQAAPEGCGFGVRLDDGVQMRASTITWKVVSGEEELTELQPVLAVGSPLMTMNYVDVSLDFRGIDEDEWLWDGKGQIRTVVADLSKSKVSVTFN